MRCPRRARRCAAAGSGELKFDRNEMIEGIRLPWVRDFLAHFSVNGWSINEQDVAEYFKLDGAHADRWLRAAAARDLIEPGEPDDGKPQWTVAATGSRLAAAKFLPRFNRKRADQLIAGFLQRVETAAAQRQDFLMEVCCVALFGSCLDGAAEDFGDVDLFCEIRWLPELGGGERVERARSLFKADGRSAARITDKMFWPAQKLQRFLRARQGAIALHDMAEAALYDTAVAVLYELPGGRLALPQPCRSPVLATRYAGP